MSGVAGLAAGKSEYRIVSYRILSDSRDVGYREVYNTKSRYSTWHTETLETRIPRIPFHATPSPKPTMTSNKGPPKETPDGTKHERDVGKTMNVSSAY